MANYYVTVTGAGDVSGDSWANAMAFNEFKTSIQSSANPGDKYFLKGGTYTATTISTSRSGTKSAPIEVIGVSSTTTAEPPTANDWAYDTDRPTLDFTYSQYYSLSIGGSYYVVRNISVLSRQYSGASLYCTYYTFLTNCYVSNTYNSNSAYGISLGNYCYAIDCLSFSQYSHGFFIGNYSLAYFCMAQDCGNTGFYCNGIGTKISFCIADSCSTGVSLGGSSTYASDIINSTIYNCTSGITATSSRSNSMIINNTISNCVHGFICDNYSTIINTFLFDYNNWYNNTMDMTWDNGSTEDNSSKGINAISVDPTFTDAAGGNFSLQSGSSLIDAGVGISLGVG